MNSSTRKTRGVVAVAALAVIGLTATACGGGASTGGGGGTGNVTNNGVKLPDGTPGKGKPAITLGTKDFPEEFLLGDLYEKALEAKGFTVNQKQNIGGSEIIDSAFKSGQIDMYPEYTGEIISSVAGDKSVLSSAQQTFDKAKAYEEQNRGATLLPQTPFEDIDVLIVKPDYAKQHGLKAIGDLNKVAPKGAGINYGAQAVQKTRYQGYVGLQQAYGLTDLKFVGLDTGVTYSALDQGSVQVADGFSTDGPLSVPGKYTTLDDPKHIMGFQHVAPVVKQDLLTKQGPAFAQTLNWVDSLLTTQAIQQMNNATQTQHQDSKTVAQKFLEANGLK